MDTIYALASARGRAGVSIIRISGPDSHRIIGELTRKPLPKARMSAVRRIWRDDEVLDQALILLFDEGHSFTGEDIAEIHLHGSVAVITAVLGILSEFQNTRIAEPGEFTRRALQNGCLDLSQVEGLADLIDAETEAQRRQALRVFSGETAAKIASWRDGLLRALALITATIDFVDEDVPVDVTDDVLHILETLLTDMRHELRGGAVAERIRDGFEVAIVGAPNTGKSTLLNALAGREAAITSDIAGTTRDVIEVRMELRGLPVTLLDTAGLRETTDQVESIGISRAVDRAEKADLRVFVLSDADEVPGIEPMPDDVIVLGKADLGVTGPYLAVSGKTGAGIDRMIDLIAVHLEHRTVGASTLVRARHLAAVGDAIKALEIAAVEVRFGGTRVELAAEHVRQATSALDTVVGRIGVEDVLGEIFANFCIGK